MSAAMGADSDGLGPKPAPRSLKEQEYLSIKHALPKTRISHAILHENTSQDRHLNMKLSAISHRQNKMSSSFDQNKRNFIETQLRKNKKWKSQDEMGAATMNFPNLKSDSSRRPSMVVLYQSPQYYEKEEEAIKQAGVVDGKLLPYMTIRRERTEILQHGGVTYTTKLPTVIELEDKKLQRYNTYCGVSRSLHLFGAPVRDERFTRVLTTLTPRRANTDIHFMTLADDNDEDADDVSGYNSDDSILASYGQFGGRKANRFQRGRPPVVFPTLRGRGGGGGDGGGDKNQSDSNTEGRFHSPTLRKSFGVKSGKAR